MTRITVWTLLILILVTSWIYVNMSTSCSKCKAVIILLPAILGGKILGEIKGKESTGIEVIAPEYNGTLRSSLKRRAFWGTSLD